MRVKSNSLLAVLVGLTLNLGFSGSAQAALQGRDLDGNLTTAEAWYDTDLGITWLADANVNGAMTWDDANTWVNNLSFTDGANVYADWRLPNSDNCYGDNCSTSEMGHLFYAELSGTAGQSILTSADPDLSKFSNLQADAYWSGTLFDANNAWNFSFNNGGQAEDFTTTSDIYSLAVSVGDVGSVVAVPEAETYAMMLAGLALVSFMAKRRKQNEA